MGSHADALMDHGIYHGFLNRDVNVQIGMRDPMSDSLWGVSVG